jgi:hypothetical protein
MNWAITLVNHGQRAAYFEQLAATVEEIGRLRWLLRQVVILADDAPGLPDAQLRDRLLALAARSGAPRRPAVAGGVPEGSRPDPDVVT